MGVSVRLIPISYIRVRYCEGDRDGYLGIVCILPVRWGSVLI